jgi:thioesterase domain-containing protein/acyl carrier protein
LTHPPDRTEVLADGAVLTSGELRAYLGQRLPPSMVPTQYVFLRELPRTPNGKVDVRALPPPGAVHPARRGRWRPSDHVEAELAGIWTVLLGVEEPQPDDDFFDLGGDSLLALTAIWRINVTFGFEMPVGTFLEAPTIAGLAAAIHREWPLGELPSLVQLTDAGPGIPLFCTHAATGTVQFLSSLTRKVDLGRPVYGLRSVGLDGRQTPLRTVEEMADRYLIEVRAVQPSGPYLLAGNCMGGLVALEMANRLLEQGEEVPFLGLMDTTLCRGTRMSDQDEQASIERLASSEPATLKQGFIELRDRLAQLGIAKPGWRLSAGDEPVPQFASRMTRILAENTYAALRYRPRPYPGPLTLFTASAAPADPASLVAKWRSVAVGGLTVHPVQADHEEIGETEDLGQALRHHLDQADPAW